MAEYDEKDFIGPSMPFEGLLVKLSSGQMYLIPKHALNGFEFNPQNQGQFASLDGQLIGVDFAVYSPGFVVYASSA